MRAKVRCFDLDNMIDAFLDARGIEGDFERDVLRYGLESRWSRLPDEDVRLLESKFGHSNILIHGDYDADGVCSTAIAVRAFGGMVDYYIPERDVGYGLKKEKVQSLTEPTMVVTVDCGVNSGDVVKSAPPFVEFVVTDHHQPRPGAVPDIDVVIDPHLDRYAGSMFYGLSGSEVSRIVFESVFGGTEAGKQLSAIGTVCDVMPMLDENRRIVRDGLESLRSNPIPPLAALMEATRVPRGIITEKDIGWRIGPVINAAGRMGSAHLAIELMLTDNREEADKIVSDMVKLNNARKRETKEATSVAVSRYIDMGTCVAAVIDDARVGLAGLVANRLMGQTGKPSVIIIDTGDEYVASCRGHHWFRCGDLVEHLSDSIKSGGGHHGAAGFSFVKSNLEEILGGIEEYAGLVRRETPNSYSDIETDVETAVSGYRVLSALAPFGHQFGPPVFLSVGVEVSDVRITKGGFTMFKICGYDAINYNESAKVLQDGDKVNIAFTVSPARRPTPSGIILEVQEMEVMGK